MRRGRAARRKPDLDDPGRSDFEEVASDIEDVGDLREWLSVQGCNQAQLVPGESLVRKFLPPGNVMELYEHYRASQALLGGLSVSQLGCGVTWVAMTQIQHLQRGVQAALEGHPGLQAEDALQHMRAMLLFQVSAG